MLLRSLASRNFVTEKYNWRWHYYFLTNEGIEYLRGELGLPAQVFPQTLTKQRPTRPAASGGAGGGGDRPSQWGGVGRGRAMDGDFKPEGKGGGKGGGWGQ